MAEPDRRILRLQNRARITYNEENIQRQYFAFPYPMMCYIRQNADTETQLKLRQTCKFFHKWSPKVIVGKLFIGFSNSTYAIKDELYVQNVGEMPVIAVVTDEIDWNSDDKRLFSKIRRCEAKVISLKRYDDLTMEEFKFFTQSGFVKKWRSPFSSIQGDDGNSLSLEDLLSHLPGADTVHADVQDISRGSLSKVVTQNNKIKDLFLQFQGMMNVDKLYYLLRKILAPSADVKLIFLDIEYQTCFSNFKAEMYAKMETWEPKFETQSFRINHYY